MRLPAAPFLAKFILQHGKPLLPTAPIVWACVSSPQEQFDLQPYTAPISGYRGRPVAERLILRLPANLSQATALGGVEIKAETDTTSHPSDSSEPSSSARAQQQHGSMAPQLPPHGSSKDHRSRGAHHAGRPHSKTSSEAAMQMVYPFSKGSLLIRDYTNNGAEYNTGLLIEDLDTFAADVAARHVDLSNKTLVTAYVDCIHWLQHATGQHAYYDATYPDSPAPRPVAPHLLDLYMTGQVTWVGRSSLEVTLELSRWRMTQPHPPSAPCPTPTPTPHSSLATNAPSSQPQPQPQHTAGQLPAPVAGYSEEVVGVDGAHEDRELVAVARFIMAARDAGMSKAVAVPPLEVGNEPERRLMERGAARQHARQHRREREASQQLTAEELSQLSQLMSQEARATAPTLEPSQHVHMPMDGSIPGVGASQPHLGTAASTAQSSQTHQSNQPLNRSASQTSPPFTQSHSQLSPRPIHDTELSQTWVTQTQDRNTTGTVFGGQLLRYGHDMALAVATAHAGEPCRLLSIQDVPFMALVPLGCVFQLTGRVVYTAGPVLHVHVRAFRSDEPSAAHTRTHHGQQPHHSSGSKGAKDGQGGQAEGKDEASSTQGELPGKKGHVSPPRRQQTHWFNITVMTRSGAAVRPILPHTLGEMREWLHAHRTHDELHQGSA